ncbi:MAG: sugar kinase [Oscillospiraceae bacterium]|nr:sugar kinase [Oscillospiraceae bacterium]
MDKVLLIGEPMELLLAEEEGALADVSHFRASVSGAEMNVAVGLSRLGLCPRYMTRLGDDPRAKRIRSFMKANGISDDLIITDSAHLTGAMMKSKAVPGKHEIYYFRQDSAASFLCEDDVDKLDLSDIRAVHFTGIFPSISESASRAARELVKRAKENEITVVFDPNLRCQLWDSSAETIALLNEFAAQSDVFLPSLKEAETLCGLNEPEKIADHYLALGTKKVVVKLGKQGAYYKSHVESGIAPTFRADAVIDTAGAGDGFAAGLISGICEEIPLGEAVFRANAVGSMQIQNASDNAGLPTLAQLREYMLSHRFVDAQRDL